MFEQLNEEFAREDVQNILKTNGVSSPVRTVLYKWRLLGCIKPTEFGPKNKALRFCKCA